MSKSTWENIKISNNYCSLSYFKYVEMRCIRLSLHCSLTSQSSSDWTSSSFHYLNLGPEKEKKKDCDTVFDELFLTTDHQIYNITRLCLHKLPALFRTTSCPASKISELTVHLEPQWWSKSSSLIIWKKKMIKGQFIDLWALVNHLRLTECLYPSLTDFKLGLTRIRTRPFIYMGMWSCIFLHLPFPLL